MQCHYEYHCAGSTDGGCWPYHMWSGAAYGIDACYDTALNGGSLSYHSHVLTWAFSVRFSALYAG